MVDLTAHMGSSRRGVSSVAHFDNCSHSSGKQRVYVRCPAHWHTACFRYAQVDKFESDVHAVATAICWAEHAKSQAETFSKADHKQYHPPDAAVRSMMRTIRNQGDQ